MTEPRANESYRIHTEARGAHWVGWVTRGDAQKPERGVVLTAANQADAEARARAWAEQNRYR